MFHNWVPKRIMDMTMNWGSWTCKNCGAESMSSGPPKRGRVRVWGRISTAHDERYSCEEWLIRSTMEA
jgi:hypothetical protein